VSITELSDGGEIVGGGVQKTVESIGRIQFRTNSKTRRLRRNFVKRKLAVAIGQSSNIFRRKSRRLGYPHTLPHMGRGNNFKSSFVHNKFQVFSRFATPPTSVGFMARAAAIICVDAALAKNLPRRSRSHNGFTHGRVKDFSVKNFSRNIAVRRKNISFEI